MQTQDYANFTLYPIHVKQEDHASLRKAMHYSDKNTTGGKTSGQLKNPALEFSRTCTFLSNKGACTDPGMPFIFKHTQI